MQAPVQRRVAGLALGAVAGVLWLGGVAQATPYAAGTPVLASTPPTSPFSGCTADDVASQSGSNAPNSEVEPRSAINPTDPANIVALYQQDRWTNGGARGLVSSVSHDGGVSWHRVVLPGITLCSGGPYQRASDPWVSFSPDGTLYAVSLVFNDANLINGVDVSRSTDQGESWSPPVPLIQDTAGEDKESVTADPTSSSRVYAVWDRFTTPSPSSLSYREPTWFSRTTNGGATWSPPRAIYDPGNLSGTIGNIVLVEPNGTLVDGFNLFTDRKNHPGVPASAVAVLRSFDHGATWEKKATVIGSEDGEVVTDPDTGAPVRAGELPDFAVDPRSGALYAVWEQLSFGQDEDVPSVNAIAFSQSTDGGATWSTPIKINQTPTNIPIQDQQAFTPTVQAAADGTVGVSYYDFRNNTAAPGATTDLWLAHCHADCASPASWASETHVAGPFDEEQAPDAGGYFLGDYMGMTTSGNVFQPFFIQAQSKAANNPTDAFFNTVGP
jgi:hypothetical protein